MSDCIFCKLANGEIPTATLYEDDEFRVILDAGPASVGHCLVIPKKHYADIYEIPSDVLGRAFELAQKIAVRMTKAMNCDGFNIVQNNKECAGQTVFHFHIHLIPRYIGDGSMVSWHPGTLSDEVKADILEKFNAVKD